MGCRPSRRSFLSTLFAAVAGTRGGVLSSDRARYTDPATEFPVVRLTSPAYSSFLPASYGRAFSRRNTFLLFSSDRGGSLEAFRMDLKSGEWRQLTEASELDPRSLTLLADERSFAYFDGASLRQASLSSLRDRELYRVPEGWRRGAGASVSSDGLYALFCETRAEAWRLQLVGMAKGAPATVLESAAPMAHPIANPRRASILYRQGDGLGLVNFDGRQNRRLKLADGEVLAANWSPDGRSVLYLSKPRDPAQLAAIREYFADTNQDRLIARTSQFASFGFNGNASVFVGASRNRASPHVLILLRANRRELTLCEHRASQPELVAPAFSPDSQRIYLHSDKDGKPAIYCLEVEKFVEKIENET